MSVPGRSLAKDLFEDMGRKVQEAASTMTEDGEPTKVVEEIESLCMNCHDDGVTKLLLTRIPFFKEIVINVLRLSPLWIQELPKSQPAGEIQPRGAKYVLKVENANDLNRQVVKSDTCIFRIEDIDLEIPAGRGQLSNVEGILRMVQQDLDQKQEERRQLQMYEGQKFPFSITVDDPAGTLGLKPSVGESGAKFSKHEYARTPEQNTASRLAPNAEATGPVEAPEPTIRPEYQANQMFYSFPASCPGCTKPCTTNMKMVNIPYFKQVVLMSTVCEHCGYRSNEVKTGGEVPEQGRRITITVQSKEDLSRDHPQVGVALLGGRFTTIEGLLTNIRNDLRSNIFGDEDEKHDSIDVEARAKCGRLLRPAG
ncbi:Zinc finger ZPR1-type protein [Botryosphaeria dothidea]|uniref:Zinc finger ZPR1-type protein n=1 Tax=Botryosphaeria dothidea TaxID=55169 RepID=A0A8H4N219_9PEZI|nr:Zinc finger ZPR1-type protein [Botryosphaeria dothidea]